MATTTMIKYSLPQFTLPAFVYHYVITRTKEGERERERERERESERERERERERENKRINERKKIV